MTYDSRPDTWQHIHTVQGFLGEVITDLQARAHKHDQSKLVSPEREVFDEYTPRLKDSTYGSDEYKSFLVGMGEGLKHHYEVNDHHPEHFEAEGATHGARGIEAMDLVQVTEMLCDWKAATMRHADGDLERSIRQNAERFGYGNEMKRLLLNTAAAFGWLT